MTNYLSLQYHIKNDSDLELVSRDQHNLPVNLLRWNEIMEEIYGANADSVSKLRIIIRVLSVHVYMCIEDGALT